MMQKMQYYVVIGTELSKGTRCWETVILGQWAPGTREAIKKLITITYSNSAAALLAALLRVVL